MFDIVEDKGLQLFVRFPQIEGIDDPAHRIAFTKTETERLIDLLRKARDWTDVAIENRVGLFSKRIGYVDDEHNETVNDADDNLGTAGAAPTDDTASDEKVVDDGATAVVSDPQARPPRDYKAINFNSYEDASTSAQFEHSVRGYSRRFNLKLDEAMKLSDVLENTLELVARRLENRDSDTSKKDLLFQ